MKQRLDQLMVARGLADSRTKAQALIMAGEVRVDGHPATKAGHQYPEDTRLELVAKPPFVSRGGEKLKGAFEAFSLSVEGLDCIDIGASTGGFTDCLLQHGAARVIALDVGHGQLHSRMAAHERVYVIERYNARYLKAEDLPFTPQFATVDVAFISLKLILPPLIAVLSDDAQLVTLIKPQFEAPRGMAPKGVVRDPEVRQAVCQSILDFGEQDMGLVCEGLIPSPIKGPEGNVEFLAWWRKEGRAGERGT